MDRKDFLRNCLALGIISATKGIPAYPRNTDASSIKNELLLKRLTAIDAHAHPYHFHGRKKYYGSAPTVNKMKQAGLVASVFAAVGDLTKFDDSSQRPYNDTLDQLGKVISFAERNKVFIIRKSTDLQFPVENDNSFGALMAVEGGDVLEGEILNLDKLYDYGVRLITLVHSFDNEIGFNQLSQSDGPLTPFGIQVVERMNELGMIIDVAHSNTLTLKSITEVSKQPVIDSHTSPIPFNAAISGPTRLRSWNEMEIIAKTGGMTGTCKFPIILGQSKL